MEVEEKAVLVSSGKAKYPCKCTKRDKRDPVTRKVPHKKEVFSDGWTKWTCLKQWCGGVKYSKGMEEKKHE